jgi:uncharacterized protein YbbC (DUF1343 family)
MTTTHGQARWSAWRVVAAGALAAVALSCSGSSSGADETRRAAAPGPGGPQTTTTAEASTEPASTGQATTGLAATGDQPAVRVGAGILADGGFDRIEGLRVGAVLNQASVVDGQPLFDLLAASGAIELAAVFVPEHGLRADAPAGETVADSVDEATGVPIHSLYGSDRSPDPEAMAGIDVLLFDLQDVGARFYTYISTMGLAMQAAAEAGVPFVVLDRPNPLGGTYVAGYQRDTGFESFIGQYPIPAVHGLTIGELAMAVKGEAWLPGLEQLDLRVVPLAGWDRTQRWPDTGLGWVPPSPGLPTDAAAGAYPGTVLFEATSVSAGRGTPEPFTVVGAPWVDGAGLAGELADRQLPGVRFEPVTFTPEPTAGVPSPPLAGQASSGVRIVVEDGAAFQPVETGVHLLEALLTRAAAAGVDGFMAQPGLLDRLAGTDELRLALESGATAGQVIAGWAADVAAFEQRRQPYLLYD